MLEDRGDRTAGAVILFPPAEVAAKLEMIADLGADIVKYTRLWDEIKAGE